MDWSEALRLSHEELEASREELRALNEELRASNDQLNIANDDLAQVIFDCKAGGIKAYGNTSGNAIAVVNGVNVNVPVGFSRADQLNVYLSIVLKKTARYIGELALSRKGEGA